MFFLEGVFLLTDQTCLLLLSNGDEAGGGQSFVLLVTLITPWGISIVPFSSFSVLISLLPADSSALITVFMFPYVTPSKNIVFLGAIMQKQLNVLSNDWSYLMKEMWIWILMPGFASALSVKKEILRKSNILFTLQTWEVNGKDSIIDLFILPVTLLCCQIIVLLNRILWPVVDMISNVRAVLLWETQGLLRCSQASSI